MDLILSFNAMLLNFVSQIVPALSICSSFSSPVFFWCTTTNMSFFFFLMKHSGQYMIFQFKPRVFPSLVLQYAIFFPENSGSFYWRMVLKTKIWALSVLISIIIPLLLTSLSWRNNKMSVCKWPIYTHIAINSSVCNCIYLYEAYISDSDPLPHESL